MVLTSSSLLDGLVALKSSVSNVAAWVIFDLAGEFEGDELGVVATTNIKFHSTIPNFYCNNFPETNEIKYIRIEA